MAALKAADRLVSIYRQTAYNFLRENKCNPSEFQNGLKSFIRVINLVCKERKLNDLEI